MRRARGTAGTTGVEMEINAGITKGIAEACAKFCHGAILAVIVIPVDLIVPATGGTLQEEELGSFEDYGCHDTRLRPREQSRRGGDWQERELRPVSTLYASSYQDEGIRQASRLSRS